MTLEPANDLLPFLAKVGTGHKGAKDLTYPEAREAMAAMLSGRFHPTTLGAFLLALRWKVESVEELAGFIDEARARMPHPHPPLPFTVLDSAGAYDGKERTLNIALPSAIVAAAAGGRILLHGAGEIPTKAGCATRHVLKALGIDPDRTPIQTTEDLKTIGLAYLDQAVYHPALYALLPYRWAVGKRTLLNTIEPLLNPLGAAAHVGGIFHPPYAESTLGAAARSDAGWRRVTITQGIEGADEMRPGKALLAEWRDGAASKGQVESATLGLGCEISHAAASEKSPEGLAQENARWIHGLLAGNATSGQRDLLLLNAALRLRAGGWVDGWEEGLAAARAALDSGEASRRLDAWVKRALASPA